MAKTALLTLLLTAALAGSTAIADETSWAPWPFRHDEPLPGKPDKVVALWTDAVKTTVGQPGIRGFGGRLLFYEGSSDTPVKVDGTLVVYAFDESNRDPNNTRPDCKYVFTPDQLPRHYSKAKVGHSYSVWIPWDVAGGMQKEITLVVRFEPKNGQPLVGEQVKEILPGRIPAKTSLASRLPATGGLSAMNGGNPAWQGANRAAYPGAPPAQMADGVRPVSLRSAAIARRRAAESGPAGTPHVNVDDCDSRRISPAAGA